MFHTPTISIHGNDRAGLTGVALARVSSVAWPVMIGAVSLWVHRIELK